MYKLFVLFTLRFLLFTLLSITGVACQNVPPSRETANELLEDTAIIQPALPKTPVIPNRSVNVADYGAIPNDSKDDTKTIQKAIDAMRQQGGGSVLFPPGRYDISVQPVTTCEASPTSSACRPHPQALILYSKLRLAPTDRSKGATLRLADKQGNYEAILATAEYWFTLEDFVLEGLTLDGNSQNNPVTRAAGSDPCCNNSPDFGAGYSQTPRYALRVYKGQRILVQNARFTHQANVNVITFNGEEVFDGDIVGSSFLNVGNIPVDYDHSSIYTNGTRIRVANNSFTSLYGAGTKGSRTAIEIHGQDQTTVGNKVSGFTYGVNVVGNGTIPGKRQLYAKNSFEDVSAGFVLWSYLDGRTLDEQSLADVEISWNTINLNLPDWFNAALTFEVQVGAGVMIEASSDAPIDNLIIARNTINFAKSSQAKSNYYQLNSAGIALSLYSHPDTPIRGLRIGGNTIKNSLGLGIYSSVPILSDKSSVIRNNVIINPARGNELRYPEADEQRSGIYLIEKSIKNLAVTNNQIRVTTETNPPLKYGVNVPSLCTGNCTTQSNTVTGSSARAMNVGSGWFAK